MSVFLIFELKFIVGGIYFFLDDKYGWLGFKIVLKWVFFFFVLIVCVIGNMENMSDFYFRY